MSEPVVDLTDPRALRALAHPLRLALVGLLRREGPLTATRAGQLLGESSASCSFHLRQLAKYGLVEEAGGGTGRQRPWQATARATRWPHLADDPDLAEASGNLDAVLAEHWLRGVLRWIDDRETEPADWQQAAALGDALLWLTPAELSELTGRVDALFAEYAGRGENAETRPAGARAVSYLQVAYPLPDEDA
ncbi:winged helix-turn-helix domain-containing protein [Actinocatenispora rupis]|nr:helix-turn-helix domain-containing protein [Actinocatenispora rupis]